MKKPLNEKEIREIVKEKVNHSGLPLEEKVNKLLQKYFTLIRRNAHYLDKDELKDRDIDFLAKNGCYFVSPKKKKMRTYTVTIQLIVECKKSSKYAWVFSGEETDRISLFEKMIDPVYYPHVLIPEFISSEELPKDTHIQEVIHPLTTKLFTSYGNLQVNFSKKKLENDDKNNTKGDKFRDLLRKAILQVIKASRHCQDIEKEDFKRWIPKKRRDSDPIWIEFFQPVIVFDGLMYRTVYSEKELTVEPIKFARTEIEYLSSAHQETKGEIHIVSIDWFSEYLEMLKDTYKIMDTKEQFWNFFGAKEHRKGFFRDD